MTDVPFDDPTVPLQVIVDPRFKQRWLDVRRGEGRRRLRILVVGVVVATVLAAAVGVLYSPLLEVSHVRIQGVAGAQAAQIRQAAAVAGHPLIDVRPGTVATRVDAVPWVADASVQTQWPGTVRIQVHSRAAVAQVKLGATAAGPQVALLDATGRVLAAPRGLVLSMPLVSGVSISGVRPGQWVRGASRGAVTGGPASLLANPPSAVAGAFALCANLPPALARSVQSISVAGDQLQAAVSSPNATRPITVLLGNQQELVEKLTALATILQQVNLTGIGQIDVRIPAEPALTPR
ncbi:MAG: FtsQ-type POTRA domain-containing protein [Acidimicrobiaceae bacterium]|nr:FtsQ-type POTRA domain-containing protein [Acidimicrobiaceae bacterium]